MHERYAYGALIFLLLLIPERRIAWLYLAFGVVFTLDLLSAAPPAPIFAEWLPFGGHRVDRRLVRDDRDHVPDAHMDDRREARATTGGPDHRVAVDEGAASV